jgi:hypothetical protein
MLHTSSAAVTDGHLCIGYNHRHFSLSSAVLQHFLQQAGIKLDVVIDMLRIRLTGASGIGSALLSVNNYLAHAVFLNG